MKARNLLLYNVQIYKCITIKRLAIVIISLLCLDIQAQVNLAPDRYNYIVEEVFGDLNKDGSADKVVISQDTLSDKAPYKLQIFLRKSGGFEKAVVSTTKFIQPQFPYGREDHRSFSSLGTIEINRGLLVITFDLIRGSFTYKFRFQNGNFELIGYSEVGVIAGGLYTIDFNLSSGTRIRKTETVDTNKLVEREEEKLLIRPLPKLQDISAHVNDDYLR